MLRKTARHCRPKNARMSLSHGERAPSGPSRHLAQHAGRDQPSGEIEPGAGRDVEFAGEQAAVTSGSRKAGAPAACRREREFRGSAAILRAASCSSASSRAPRCAASATQSRYPSSNSPPPLARERVDPGDRRRPERQRAGSAVAVKAPERSRHIGRGGLEPVLTRQAREPRRHYCGSGEQARTLAGPRQRGEPGVHRFVVGERGAKPRNRRPDAVAGAERLPSRELGEPPQCRAKASAWATRWSSATPSPRCPPSSRALGFEPAGQGREGVGAGEAGVPQCQVMGCTAGPRCARKPAASNSASRARSPVATLSGAAATDASKRATASWARPTGSAARRCCRGRWMGGAPAPRLHPILERTALGRHVRPKFALARAISPSVSAAKRLRTLADCVHVAGLPRRGRM
jgi:hypothetical protein